VFLRFLLVGGSGLFIDAGLTYLLVRLDVAPWLARMPAILVAMAYTWLANRYFTYRVTTARSTSEALRYVVVAIATAAVNYLIYFVFISNGVWPAAAVTLATAFQTILSFQGYRHFVFRIRR